MVKVGKYGKNMIKSFQNFQKEQNTEFILTQHGKTVFQLWEYEKILISRVTAI